MVGLSSDNEAGGHPSDFISTIHRLPDGHRLSPHRNLTSPHSDGKAFSLPATAHGMNTASTLGLRPNASIKANVLYPAKLTTVRLRHEPNRSLCFTKTVFSNSRGHGGPVTRHISPSYPVLFLFTCQGTVRLIRTSGHHDPKLFASHKPFHFLA